MPTVFRYNGVRFFFYSNEGSPREPVHIHAERGDSEAKFWLRPDVMIGGSRGFDRRELADLARVVLENRDLIERRWHEHFG
jgi:hypothetical protein